MKDRLTEIVATAVAVTIGLMVGRLLSEGIAKLGIPIASGSPTVH